MLKKKMYNLPEEQIEQVKAVSSEYSISESHFVRLALEQALKKLKKDKNISLKG